MDIEILKEAYKRIETSVIKTPLIPLELLENSLGFIPWVKLENMQNIGAFKIRGVMNAVLQLSEVEKKKGFITASSGNHGYAVAYAAKLMKVPALIILPDNVTKLKHQRIKNLGAETLLVDPQNRINIAKEIAHQNGMAFIHPFDDNNVIAGQASIGFEIIEQFPDVKKVIVPLGGGGLISGIAMAIKSLKPEVSVIGIETAAVPKFFENLHRDSPLPVQSNQSIADALLSNKPGVLTFNYVKKYVDEVYTVTEDSIRKGYNMLLTEGKIFCEPSSAVGIAAILQYQFKPLDMKDSVFVISGGNVDINDSKLIIK